MKNRLQGMDEWLRKNGYPCLMDYYVTMHPN